MYKILLVDDEPMVIHGLCRQIDWESYNLVLAGTAETGESALSILKERQIDILFTDICMPKMDGLALISEAKKQNPFIRSVIISSHADFCYAKKALLLGVENYLLKPIAQTELDKTLEKTIDNLDRDCIRIKKDGADSFEFRNNILDRWVNMDIQDYEFYERAELLHINLTAQQYEVCVIDFIDSDSTGYKLLNAKLFLEKCKNIFFSSFEGECFIDRCNRVVIIFNSDGLPKSQDKLELCLRSIMDEGLNEDIKAYASVSSISDGVEDVAHCYANAVEYLNYRFLDPDTDYIFCGEFLEKYNSYGCEPILIQFSKAFEQEDHEMAKNTVKKLLNHCSKASLKTFKQCIVPFIIILIRQMNESGHISERLPSTATTGFDTLNAIDSIEKLELWFFDTIDKSLEVIRKRKESFHLLVQRTLDIIKRDYYNTDLSLKIIAADFKVSPAYLGQLFREATGKYFNDYLTETRLRASRALLLDTDLKIREILYRIGISNQSYFNRIFKKAYGLSPLAFRYQNTSK